MSNVNSLIIELFTDLGGFVNQPTNPVTMRLETVCYLISVSKQYRSPKSLQPRFYSKSPTQYTRDTKHSPRNHLLTCNLSIYLKNSHSTYHIDFEWIFMERERYTGTKRDISKTRIRIPFLGVDEDSNVH
jgi:hypothetical protein